MENLIPWISFYQWKYFHSVIMYQFQLLKISKLKNKKIEKNLLQKNFIK